MKVMLESKSEAEWDSAYQNSGYKDIQMSCHTLKASRINLRSILVKKFARLMAT